MLDHRQQNSMENEQYKVSAPSATSSTLSKKVGWNQHQQSLKISPFPIPPLLQNHHNFSQMIEKNNSMIQDILSKNKKNQQVQSTSNLQNHLFSRMKANSSTQDCLKMNTEENKALASSYDQEQDEEDNHLDNGLSISPRSSSHLSSQSKPKGFFSKNLQLNQKLLESKNEFQQTNSSSCRFKTPSTTHINTMNKQRQNGNSISHKNEDIFRIKTSSFVGNTSVVEYYKNPKSITPIGRRDMHALEKAKNVNNLNEITLASLKQPKINTQPVVLQDQISGQQLQQLQSLKDDSSELSKLKPLKKQIIISTQSEDTYKYNLEVPLSQRSRVLNSNHNLINNNNNNNNNNNIPMNNSSIQLSGPYIYQIPSPLKYQSGNKFYQSYQQLSKILKDSSDEKKIQNFPQDKNKERNQSYFEHPPFFTNLEKLQSVSISDSKGYHPVQHKESISSRHSTCGSHFPLISSISHNEESLNTPQFTQLFSFESKKDTKENVAFQQLYENSLKKEVPSALSESPSTRQDVLGFKKWMQTSIQSIFKIAGQQRIDHFSYFMNLSVKELIRQISLECQERGEALQAVNQHSKEYQGVMWQEQYEVQKQNFQKQKKQIEVDLLHSHEVYQEIFSSKDKEIEKLKSEAEGVKNQMKHSSSQLDDQLTQDKYLRLQIKQFKEIASFLKKKHEESDSENKILKCKINKISEIRAKKKEEMREAAREKAKYLARSGGGIDYADDYSSDSSINSDLFINKETKSSEKDIQIAGIQESIENLNYVPFTNPDDIKRYEGEETQTGASLLITGIFREEQVQTELQGLISSEYNQLMTSSESLQKFIYQIENDEAQIQFLKEREKFLLEEVEMLKSLKDHDGRMKSQMALMLPLSMTSLQKDDCQSPDNQTGEFKISSSPNKKIIEQVDSVLTEKYKGIMEKLNIDPKDEIPSSSSSQSEISIDDAEDNDGISPGKKKGALYKAVQAKGGRQLGQKLNQIESLFNDVGKTIVEKVKKNKYPKFRNFMPLPTLLKQINLIYLERLKMTNEANRVKEQECSNFTYYFLTKLYGFKKIVDQKYIIFILSVKKMSNVLRVNLFARFLGLLDGRSTNFSLDEFNKYIEVLNFVFNVSNLGLQPSSCDIESRYLVPFIRVMAFVGNFADTRMTFEENQEFKKEIESLKENDLKGIHTAGLIDFDVFLNKMLAKYRQLLNRAKTYVINAFAASDLDGNGVCNLDEFLILNRHIETDLFDEEILTQIFQENTDKLIDGEPNLSFDKFAVVCVDYNLFSDEAQDRFLGVKHKREIDFKMQELQAEWAFKERELKAIFEQLILITIESQTKWLEIISVLKDKLTTVAKGEEKPLLIAFKILQNEARQLLLREEECKKDEELLTKYELKALQEQKEYQIHIQENSFSKENLLSPLKSPRKSKKSMINSLNVPSNGSKARMSQYAHLQPQDHSSNGSSAKSQNASFFFNGPLIEPQKERESIQLQIPSLIFSESKAIDFNSKEQEQFDFEFESFSTNILSDREEMNLKEANFIELMMEKLKNVSNKEKYLKEIIFKNGVEEITEDQQAMIGNIIRSLEISQLRPQQAATAKQLLFQFFMKAINKNFNKK